jgi:hypothetical protein
VGRAGTARRQSPRGAGRAARALRATSARGRWRRSTNSTASARCGRRGSRAADQWAASERAAGPAAVEAQAWMRRNSP